MILPAGTAHALAGFYLSVLAVFSLPPPNEDGIGAVRLERAPPESVLYDMARRHDLGVPEILAANPELDPWIPGAHRIVTLPTAFLLPDVRRDGLVINLAELRLYYFQGDKVYTAAVGIGRRGFETPTGETKIVRKAEDPVWYPPPGLRAERPDLPAAVKPGPDNPLGRFAFYLSWPGYLIHATNRPDGIGQLLSHGCIRLYPESAAALYSLVPVGAPVRIVNYPIKIGYWRQALYAEVHPPLKEAGETSETAAFPRIFNTDTLLWAKAYAARLARRHGLRLDEAALHRALRDRSGLPQRISGK